MKRLIRFSLEGFSSPFSSPYKHTHMHAHTHVKENESEIRKHRSKKRRYREGVKQRELGQGVTAGAHGSDSWQQVPSSVTCRWVMNTQVNEIAGGIRKHAVKHVQIVATIGAIWKMGWNHKFTRNCSLPLCCGIHLASINVKKSQHLLPARMHRLTRTSTPTCFTHIPVSSWQSDCDNSVKWRMCDHCAATHSLWGWGGGALSGLSCRKDW